MKNRLKEIVLLLIVVSFTCFHCISAFAANDISQSEALDWVYDQEGDYLDWDNVYGAQCVDLIKYYYDLFGQAKYAKGNGCDYTSNTLPPGWVRIKDTSDFIPEPGDIAVWGTSLSTNGHVAIVLSANSNSFVSMDQNWPKGGPCKRVTHSYNKFWGVIRPSFALGTIPSKVRVKSFTTESSTSITINWVAVSADVTYLINRWEANTDDTYTIVQKDITGTSYTDTGLKPNTKYWYRVRAVNSSGVSEVDHEVTDILTTTAVPEMVHVNSWTAESGTSIMVNWEAAFGASSYRVDRWEVDHGDTTYTKVAEGITGTSYLDTGLKENTEYWYRVWSVNGAGKINDVDHEVSDILTSTVVVGMPTGVKASGTSTTSIIVSWDETPGATSYRIYRWQAWKGDTTATNVELEYVGTSYIDTDLLPGTQYYYRIYANNDKGQSIYSPEVRTATFCETPTGVHAEGTSTTSINVSWDETPGATSYRIYRWQAWNGNTTATDIKLEHTETSYTDEGLLPGTQYYYRIYANNEGGQSDYSAEVLASTVFEPDYILPTGLEKIDEEAMSNLPATMIQCPETLTKIGTKAFAGCDNLTAIYIPNANTLIAEDAFEGKDGVSFTIWSADDSAVKQYAIDHGYSFGVFNKGMRKGK